MIRIGIVGATGYTGAELLRLLSLHDDVEVTIVTSNALSNFETFSQTDVAASSQMLSALARCVFHCELLN